MNITQEADQMYSHTIYEKLSNYEAKHNFRSKSLIYTKTVGAYRITPMSDHTHYIDFCYQKKPKWFNRFCTNFFLGWTWIDFD